MDRLPGMTLDKAWLEMSWDAKVFLVNCVVDALAQMFHMRSNAIGNTYRKSDFEMLRDPHMVGLPISPNYLLGKVVSMGFFWDKRITQDIPKGPFLTSEQWLKTRLLLTRSDADAVIANSSDEGEIKDAEFTLGLITQLMELMPRYFQSEEENDGLKWCCLHHDDLHRHNILANKFGVVQGILDWECVHYVPLWKACQLPSFLQSYDRIEKPVKDIYAHNDDGTPGEGYLEDQLEYELTLLRQVFIERMAQVQPLWSNVHQASGKKLDFCFAVENCDTEFDLKRIKKWLDMQAAGGEYYSLIYNIKHWYH